MVSRSVVVFGLIVFELPHIHPLPDHHRGSFGSVDLDADIREKHNLAGANPDVVKRLMKLIEGF